MNCYVIFKISFFILNHELLWICSKNQNCSGLVSKTEQNVHLLTLIFNSFLSLFFLDHSGSMMPKLVHSLGIESTSWKEGKSINRYIAYQYPINYFCIYICAKINIIMSYKANHSYINNLILRKKQITSLQTLGENF